MQHTIASKWDLPNAVGAQLTVPSQLNIHAWDYYLDGYHDADVVKYLRFGWPISYTAKQLPKSTPVNHPSANNYEEHIQHYLKTELGYQSIAGPFQVNPLSDPLVCSPLQTVPKRGSSKRRVVMDSVSPTDILLITE